MNPSFWLLYGLSDIFLMHMNSNVVFYELLNDVRVVLNYSVNGLRLINLYWIDIVSLSIIV